MGYSHRGRLPIVSLVVPRRGSQDQLKQGAGDRRGDDGVVLRKLDSQITWR